MIVAAVFASLVLGVLLTYFFYWLALTHRNVFILTGAVFLIGGCLLYGMHHDHRTVSCCTCRIDSDAINNATRSDDGNKVLSAALSGLSSVNKSLSSFFPSRGGYDDSEEVAGCERSWYFPLFWIFHFLALLYMVSIFVAVFGVELVNRVSVCLRSVGWPCVQQPFRLRRKPGVFNVFWGVDEESCVLASQVGTDGLSDFTQKSIVFVLPEGEVSWLGLKNDDCQVRNLIAHGWKWIIGNTSNMGLLKSARRHFFLGSDGHKNVAHAEALMTALEKLKEEEGEVCVQKPVSVYVRAWPEADDDALYKWSDGWNTRMSESKMDVEVEIVREESIVSRDFLIKNPMLDCPGIKLDACNATVSGEFRILVLGFGVQGERLMSDMVCDAQFLDANGKRVPIHVDVADQDAASFGWFKGNCQVACQRFDIKFFKMNVRSERFWHWLRTRREYNRVVVCTHDDVVNLELANDIANYYGVHFGRSSDMISKVVFARVREHSLSGAVTRDDNKPYRVFGDSYDTYLPNALLNDKWNRGAVILNGIWYAGGIQRRKEELVKNPAYDQCCWRGMSTFDKESTRASLFHQRNILRLIGYRVSAGGTHKGTMSEDMESAVVEKKNKFINVLAESEHIRWIAFHLLRGWLRWTPDEAELQKLVKELAGKSVKTNTLKKLGYKLHAALADIPNLEIVDQMFKKVNEANSLPVDKPSKDKDNDLVYGIEAVKCAGFSVV